MTKNIWIIIAVVAVIVGGIYISNNIKNGAMVDELLFEQESIMRVQTDDAVMKEEKSVMNDDETIMSVGSYEVYAPEKVILASVTHDVVLFFKADWCPTCRALDTDIKDNLSKIPESLTILRVDYDNSTALKQKYGITYQHTFVQVDKNGNLIKKWSGSPTLSALISEIK